MTTRGGINPRRRRKVRPGPGDTCGCVISGHPHTGRCGAPVQIWRIGTTWICDPCMLTRRDEAT